MEHPLCHKSALITNVWVSNFTGSELNCLSLATALQARGYTVEVAAFDYGMPIIEEFNRANIPVKNVLHEELSQKHYDIIWAHHSMVLDHLLFTKKITADRIISSCLSPFEPFEVPPIYANEVSLCLANSEESKTQMVAEGLRSEHIIVFPNYVDSQWLTSLDHTLPVQRPNRISIVSNHVAAELLTAAEMLRNEGCTVDIYGMDHTFIKITPAILKQYDLVITIGKTVQFCMAMQLPIYCYDIHGGPGFLESNTLETAAYYNFSGRGFGKKSANEIVTEILTSYSTCFPMLPILEEYIYTHSILEQNLERILTIVEHKPVNCNNIVANYPWVHRNCQSLSRLFPYLPECNALRTSYHTLEAGYRALETEYRALETEYRALEAGYRTLETGYRTLETAYHALEAEYIALRSHCSALENENTSLRSTLRFKLKSIIKKILKPLIGLSFHSHNK